MISFDEAFRSLPLIAILRGLPTADALPISTVLIEAGFRIVEVPLNSPEALRSIEMIAARHGEGALIGAGTVMMASDVDGVKNAGGRLIVMPHADDAVIAAAKRSGLWCVPGVATPTEAFAMLAAGADALKLFPGEAMPPRVVKAWRAVVPSVVRMLPVGGVTPEAMADYVSAGADGFGLGGALYQPGDSTDAVGAKARAFIEAWRKLRNRTD